jgi:hypothetical protein
VNIEQVEGIRKLRPQDVVAPGGGGWALETGLILPPPEHVLALTNNSSQIGDRLPPIGCFFIRSLLLAWRNGHRNWLPFDDCGVAGERRLRAKRAGAIEE